MAKCIREKLGMELGVHALAILSLTHSFSHSSEFSGSPKTNYMKSVFCQSVYVSSLLLPLTMFQVTV